MLKLYSFTPIIKSFSDFRSMIMTKTGKKHLYKLWREISGSSISWNHFAIQFKEIWIFGPIQQGTEKTWSCFPWDTEQQYWAVTVQYLFRVKKISMTSNVLPLHFSPSQVSSSQNSKFVSHLLYCEVDFLKRS
jgi:hypothetical protein